ncbi:MAG TPA: OmpA family protein [Polyangiaceae bacterium]
MKQLTGRTCMVVLGALLLSACGAAVAPKELLSARDAYAAAEGSSAKTLAPVQLEEAKQALAEADHAFSEGEDEQRIRDLAYIAGRKAEIAQSRGKRSELNKEREAAGMEGTKLQEQVLESKTKALKKTKEELDREQREAAAAKAQLVAVQGRLSAALKSLDELAQVKEEARGVVITLSGSVLFATGKHQLLDIAKDRLNEVAKAIKDQGFKAIVVEGYTDSRGSETANEQLSLKRAEEVRAHLVSQGIPPNKITAVGRGEASPVADNNTAEGRANNRRVELVITPEN